MMTAINKSAEPEKGAEIGIEIVRKMLCFRRKPAVGCRRSARRRQDSGFNLISSDYRDAGVRIHGSIVRQRSASG